MFNAFLENAQSKVSESNQFMIIGPSTHCGYTEATENTIVGERELGDASLPWLDIQLRWYDYWLKGKKNGITDMPKVQYLHLVIFHLQRLELPQRPHQMWKW